MKIFNILVVISYLATISVCTTYTYYRALECQEHSVKSCNRWNQTGYLVQDWNWFSCFPGNATVLGENGPIEMKNLKIGDMIFSLNPETLKQQFVKVIGWLHRDQTSLFQFNQIKTSQNQSYFASQFHNIAYQQQGNIQFKFLNQLNPNESVILNNGQTAKIQSRDQQFQFQGLFSPLTQNGLFYIYPMKENINQNEDNMILVHSLSQIKNPRQNFGFTLMMFNLIQLFYNEQKTHQEEYVHPLMNHFSFIYGSDWVNHKSQIKHLTTSGGGNGRYRNMIRKIAMIRGLQMQTLDTMLI